MPALNLQVTNLMQRLDGDPVDRIVDEHYRQQALCHVLERVARNPRHSAGSSELGDAWQYLGNDLITHIADEEDDLLPLLCHRCHVGDAFGEVAAALRDNHAGERSLADSMLPELQRLIDGRPLANPVRFFGSAMRLSRMIRRHLVWENAVLVPLARRRLKAPDLPYLAEKMAMRRTAAGARA